MDKMSNGSRYGLWTVVDASREPDYKVKCVCACGTERRVLRHKLTAGQTKSCGCERDSSRNRRVADLARGVAWPELAPEKDAVVEPGARFGRWTALSIPFSETGARNRVALCQCECGNERTVLAWHLTAGRSKSCGCLRRDGARARAASVS